MSKIKIINCILLVISMFILLGNVQAVEDYGTSSFEGYVAELNEYASSTDIQIDISKVASDLQSGKGFSYDNIFSILCSLFFKQFKAVMSTAIVIVIVVIISSVIKSMGIDKQSEVIKLTNIVCFASLSVILVSNFIEVLEMFKNTTLTISNVMQIVSPFLLGLLIVNGAITSVGIIQPLILFISSFTGYIISNVIVPILILSIMFAIIGSIGDKSGIVRLSQFFRKLAIWLLGIFLTVFIGVISMETSITKDVDSLAVKTTTAAVSNFVPVVGKFFSDSLETVVGASKIITKAGGLIGIIVMVIVALTPILKLVVISFVYNIISIISEIIDADGKMVKIIQDFSDVYKTMCGILIANSLIFIISTAIILNLSSSIVK